MTQPRPTIKHALPGAGAYAPEIAILLGPKQFDLKAADKLDVIDLRVTLEKDQLGGFSLVLANTDARFELGEGSPFKYTDSSLFDINTEITIGMGYAGNVKKVLVGEILSFSPSFPQSGLPTVALTGADRLNRLRRSKPGNDVSKSFPQRADWEIAQQIAARHDLGFVATREGPKHPLVMQKDKDDLDFLLECAKTVGYDCYIDVDDQGRDTLHFIRPLDQSDARPVDEFTYEWGVSLRSFTPRLRIGRQVAKVTVRGWDPRTKQVIEYTATVNDLPRTPGKGRTGAEVVADKEAGAKDERIVDLRVSTRDEAKTTAINLLERNANEFLTGTGEVMGEPDLRPGSIVNLGKLGDRFSGPYTVKKVEHQFGAGGYTTTFEVERIRENAKPKAANPP